MNDITLRLTGIHKAYQTQANKPVVVLKDANLTLQPGEVVALVAPSGSGKSTLLHITGLLDAADAGTVEICGQDLTGASDDMRTKTRRNDIGFVYQFHHLLPEFTAAENIILPQLAAGVSMREAEDRAKHLMGEIGLTSRLHHRPAALSGGEQQRVAFCRALANRPALLLADEPTGNLDPATSDLVFETLLKLVHQTGLSALIATHNMELAARMDRQVRLVDGGLELS